MDTSQCILFVDDESEVRKASTQTLELAGFEVQPCASAEAALSSLGDAVHVVVTDVKLPGMDGVGLLKRLQEFDADLPVILITAHGDVPMAVDAMRIGAYDFIQKPYAAFILVDSVRRACEKRRLVLDNRRLRSQLESAGIESKLLGTSRSITHVRRAIAELGPTNANVIVRGETGVGKEVVARCLHECGSRSARPFVAINCGAIPETIFESELFGHEAGAFTGAATRRIGKLEHASGGTILLDEIESMPLGAQVKLLRVLQDHSIERLGGNRTIPIDVRVVVATQLDLREASRKGSFRSDLYYRLAVAEIIVPPLRDRTDDVPLLFEYFVSEAAQLHARQPRSIDHGELKSLLTHAWPGNVRELRNVAERFVLSTGRLNLDSVFEVIEMPIASGATTRHTLAQQLDEVERSLIIDALTRSKGDVRAVMSLLALPRRTLNEKMLRYGILRQNFAAGNAESKDDADE